MGKQLAIWGTVLQSGMLVGLAGTVIGMVRAFAKLSKQGDASTQDALARDISLALYAHAGGLLVAAVGIILLLVALWGVKYRAPWFRIALWILAVLWLFSFPIGTILAIVVMIYLSNHREEFAEHENREGLGTRCAVTEPLI